MKLGLFVDYLRIVFTQFSFLGATRQIVARVMRALLDPNCIPSYGQTGEDRIIESLLPNQRVGFFVDVGCNRPVANSNTYKLYRRGWHGINIDANEELIKEFDRVRAKDKNICSIVSDREETITFNVFDDPLLSTVSTEQAAHVCKTSQPLRMVLGKSRKLTSILDECDAPLNIDLLNVDVEGHDLEVLRSLDFSKYTPQLIVKEMHGFDIDNPVANPICAYLRAKGYRLVGYAIMNGYFMRNA